MKKKLTLVLLSLIAFLNYTLAQNTRSSISYTEAPFFHGVASGDPLPSQVMIWTKVTPPSGAITEIDVFWQIATDTAFLNIVNFGKTTTTDASDFTVKIDVCGLQPNTYYYYVFRALDKNSIIGRTKTAPIGLNLNARYAVASCSNYEHGFFNAYESMANRNDLDAVIHLGDYYYEYESGGFSSDVVTDDWGRTVLPTNEAINLADYRTRHSHYKLDNQLQLVHQMYPFITTWDDHETANDSYKNGAENHDPATEGPWVNRKVSSFQAYNEWMPVRSDTTNLGKVWRKLEYGNLLDLIILDTRIWGRDEQDMGETNNPNHKLLGDDQFEWLENQLLDTTSQWKIICNQMMMAPLEIFGIAVNADQWDGYNSERNRLINFIETHNIKNVVVLTGDIHTSWVNKVPGNSTGTAATEFVVTSVTSPGLDVIETALGQLPSWLLNLFGGSIPAVIKSFNSHMEYVNIEDHGYMVFNVNQTKAQGDYVFVEREDTVFSDDFGASYYTPNNVSTMIEASAPLAVNPGPIKPPLAPVQSIPFALLPDTFYTVMNENAILNNCLVDVTAYCPSITSQIIQQATFGNAIVSNYCFQFQTITNYFGLQQFSIQVCNPLNATCDTVVVLVNVIGDNDITHETYQIMNDSTIVFCPTFNDLTTLVNNVGIVNNPFSGVAAIDINNCIVFTPDTSFCGVDAITIYACDNNGICDTMVLDLIIDGYVSTTIVHLYGLDNQLLNNCLGFDDLQGNLVQSTMEFNSTNGNALLYNDTCLSYKSNVLFNGIDTITLYACDDFVPEKCDTIIYYMHISHPTDTIIDTTAIQTFENNEFAILGIYPNPFDVELIIQYYNFISESIALKLYNIEGKSIYQETIKDNTTGLKYARLKTASLSKGSYLLEISNSKFSYTKKVIKY